MEKCGWGDILLTAGAIAVAVFVIKVLVPLI